MNDLEKNSDSILDDILDSISDEEFEIADKKMSMAAKIADAMEDKGWKHKDLIAALGKGSPSEVTRWLSGTHNFTMDTLIKLERALEIDLLNIEIEEEKVFYGFNRQVSEQQSNFMFANFYDSNQIKHVGEKIYAIQLMSIRTAAEA
ncbi:helix-turn-helix domain-containing protein [Persicitalea jodogahamensis]|uniref:HTH cro/C1-type domain-containing protein n=1 Tax=Persicitalea jodogahamensis TaxID=402147 RepID=A0A8J3D3B1_9BACT|nr:helix-turn-helix transcriptional regulator [Persicitalea jodogahamensis]GHB64091.1 hypothetical protein GCM10007390_17460 [Persicitalea jodogahamensis]